MTIEFLRKMLTEQVPPEARRSVVTYALHRAIGLQLREQARSSGGPAMDAILSAVDTGLPLYGTKILDFLGGGPETR